MIVGLTGQLQAGKDTVADHLVEHYGFTKIGFSDKLYECVCTLFGITMEQAFRFKEEGVEVHLARPNEWPKVTLTQPITMRTVLQRMGTDVGREIIHHDLWTHLLAERMGRDTDYVIRDVRFDNEAEMLYQVALNFDVDATIWRVIRPGYEGDSHASEAGIHDDWVRMEIHNNGTLPWLYNAIDEIMEVQYGRKRVSTAHG